MDKIESCFYIIFTFIFVILGCSNHKFENSIPKLELSSSESVEFTLAQFEENIFRNSVFAPFFIGEYSTEIIYTPISDYRHYKKLDSLSFYGLDFFPEINTDTNKIEIFIDTSQTIKYCCLSPVPIPPHPDSNAYNFNEQLIKLKSNLVPVLGYPVFILNKSDKNIFLGQFNSIAFSTENKINGVWKQIDKPLLGDNYDKSLLLPPNWICITSFPIYENLVGQKIRLKLGNNFSNEFIIKL